MTVKNALITGGGKRVGYEIAKALKNEGWNVVIHCNNTPVKDFPSVKADLTKFSEVMEVVSKTNKALGEITLLINNASIFNRVDFETTNEKLFDDNFSIHVKAPFFLAQEFAKQCSNGQIINIIDSFTIKNKKQFFAYALSKKTLRNLSQMLAVQLAPKIRINAIFPGPITEFSDNSDQDFLKKRVGQLPMKKLASISEITAAIINLTKNNLTGQEIFIDGGEQLI